ncbi:MAG TPA: metal-dependent hydrolase [Bryobacteraceae bacterium]|nr:metal-dependent hydrolase [Bryobacteraceae bacterium]
MDPLTHTLTGLFLSRTGLNRWTPLAAPILILAANAPDIDIVTLAGGSLNYLHYHRHLTHSILAMPAMALLPVVLVRAAARKPVQWIGAFGIAMIGVASHLLLDLTNMYGIRLLTPFSGRWFRLDLTNLFDLWIWIVLLLGVVGPLIGRLVGSEITSGTMRNPHHGRGFAVFCLMFLLLYNCGRYVLHSRAVASLESRIYQEASPLRVAALPDAANPLKWKGLVETNEFYAVANLNLATEFDPTRATIFRKPDADPAIEAARRTTTFEQFLQFSEFPLWRVSPVTEPENGKLVQVYDMRFGTPLTPGFMASALLSARLSVLETQFEWNSPRPR